MWKCNSCSAKNDDSFSFCCSCGVARPKESMYESIPDLMSDNNIGTESQDWQCVCGEKNNNDFPFCSRCGKARPVPRLPRDWVCVSCGQKNSESSKFCSSCGAPKGGKKSNVSAWVFAAVAFGAAVAILLAVFLVRNTTGDTNVYVTDFDEDDIFAWRNIVKYDYFSDDGEYVIGLDARGRMHACSLGLDVYNDDFVREIRSLSGVRDYVLNCSGFSRVVVAAIHDDGRVTLCCASRYPDDDTLTLIREASELRNTVSVVFATDDNKSPKAMYALTNSGSVTAVGRDLNSTVLSWTGLKELCCMVDSFIGLKKDGNCYCSGSAFGRDQIPVYYSAHLDASSWTNVAKIYTTSCPWGWEVYTLRNDGKIYRNSSELIMDNVSRMYFDRISYHSFFITNDCICHMSCLMGCTCADRKNVLSVGANGICITAEGYILPVDYGDGRAAVSYRVGTGFDLNECRAELASVDFRYGDNRYFALGADGRIYILEELCSA